MLKSAGGFKVKSITVNPSQKLSLQSHRKRAEHWVLARGRILVTLGKKKIALKAGGHVFIPKKALHRIENPGNIPAEIIEIQTGSYLGEDDIERFEDAYGRT